MPHREMGILIVDDSRQIQKQLQSYLRSEGIENVYSAMSAPDAYETLQLDQPGPTEPQIDLILMDIKMPDINGIDATREIKSREKFQDVPILIITGEQREESLQKAFSAGAVDYLRKPLRKIEFMARVRSFLNMKAEKDIRKETEEELRKTNEKLQTALSKIKTLQGLIPICMHCKKILNNELGCWQNLERYLQEHSEAKLSHGVCPECNKKHYPSIKVPNCWEYKKCGQEKLQECPAFIYEQGHKCWGVAGTMCEGSIQGTFAKKISTCIRCDFYKLNAPTEEY